MSLRVQLIRRSFAGGLHLLISVGVALLAAALVFGLWYPGPYRLFAGGEDLFFLLIAVDVVIGPVLTFAVFDAAKGRSHLRRDLAVIALVQMLALGYGLHTVFVVRPIAMVFEGSRFRVVAANGVRVSELPEARAEYQKLPLTGPWLLGTRDARSVSENNDALFKAAGGADLGQRPSFWQPYAESKTKAIARSRPLELLLSHHSERSAELRAMLRDMRVEPVGARFLPVLARGDWTAIIDSAGDPVGFLPVTGFF